MNGPRSTDANLTPEVLRDLYRQLEGLQLCPVDEDQVLLAHPELVRNVWPEHARQWVDEKDPPAWLQVCALPDPDTAYVVQLTCLRCKGPIHPRRIPGEDRSGICTVCTSRDRQLLDELVPGWRDR